ncbi:heterokaryon incompatibility protein-domain-containing protein [Lasiosphaeria hispida]|uniref:Heterokaryon incompatibility protein-domain-containing protein n=1 Tax=Lasiosphaeria hispida TaxID=260671 RepID=A0AAJ0MDY4_9PEZI|nr:heterokaryon incompatibility protein-domain-containing protein [Lasiosphaeria hispida]
MLNLRYRPALRLCTKCQAAVDRYSSGDYTRDTRLGHHTWPKLKSSAANGCGLCSQIALGVNNTFMRYYLSDEERRAREDTTGHLKEGKTTAEQIDNMARDYDDINNDPKRPQLQVVPAISFRKPLEKSEHISHNTNFLQYNLYKYKKGKYVGPMKYGPQSISCLLEISEKPGQHAIDYDSSSGSLSTEDALPLCKLWYQRCCSSHETCKSDSKQVVPTRLICLRGGNPRISTAGELHNDSRYATLSHSWGGLEFPTLTSTTLPSFRERIPPEALPKTFGDAIRITQYLGLDYLWIDSLCILQDSAEDWRAESSMMTEVYQGAALNIAATVANDASLGCFWPRRPSWKCQVQATSTQSQQAAIYDLFQPRWNNPWNNTLKTRAWVVQERLLSRRTLHFAENQVFWECDQNPACELVPEGYPSRDLSLHDKNRPHSDSFNLLRKGLTLGHWPRIVNMYTSCKLTKPTDRHIAIGGLARLIHQQTREDYVAGLWRRDLEDQLRWFAWKGFPFKRFPRINNPPLAPSWSWVSLNGEVRLKYQESESSGPDNPLLINVQHVDQAVLNSFGQLGHARLRLQCDLFFLGTIGLEAEFGSFNVRVSDGRRLSGIVVDFDCNLDENGATVRYAGLSAYFLCIRPNAPPNGLVLAPTLGTRGEYRRIGCFHRMESPYRTEERARMISEANLVEAGLVSHFAAVVEGGGGGRQCFIDLV